jgi:hypothetical protein
LERIVTDDTSPRPYTPTTDNVRYWYAAQANRRDRDAARATVDRWLAAHDADHDRLARIVEEIKALCDEEESEAKALHARGERTTFRMLIHVGAIRAIIEKGETE